MSHIQPSLPLPFFPSLTPLITLHTPPELHTSHSTLHTPPKPHTSHSTLTPSPHNKQNYETEIKEFGDKVLKRVRELEAEGRGKDSEFEIERTGAVYAARG